MNQQGLQLFHKLFQDRDPSEISDIQFRTGKPVYLHTKSGMTSELRVPPLDAGTVCDVASLLFDLQERSQGFAIDGFGDDVVAALKKHHTLDFSSDGVPLANGSVTGRMRVQCHLSMTGPGVTCRILSDNIPPLDVLGLSPDTISAMQGYLNRRQGFALVTGPTGSGKSTTLASLMDWLRIHHRRHIVTVEDPIEYRYEVNDSGENVPPGLITQQEVGTHVTSFHKGLIDALRKAPHLILLGEIRNRETMETAMEAAQTGHIVISTLHTNGAVKTMSRILEFFPRDQHRSVLGRMSEVLMFVLSQGLIPTEQGRVLNYEFLQNNSSAVRSGIASYDGGEKSLEDAILHSGNIGWDRNLARLQQEGRINFEQFQSHRMHGDDADGFLHFQSA